MKNKRIQRFKGFTLVEIIAVIVILSAIALPRFFNVSNSAHEAVVVATGGAFSTGLSLIHTTWLTTNATSAQDNISFGSNDLDVNANGWPISTTDGQTVISSHEECINIWNGLMDNPPSIRPFTVVDPEPKFGSSPSTDYQATRTNTVTCWYIYRHISNNELAIEYNSTTGTVRIDSIIGNGFSFP